MQRARLWYKLIFTALFCTAVGSFFGCSQQKRYEVLSFFFDGVPTPGGAKTAEGKPVSYLHKPYAEGKCGSCHASDDMEMSIARPLDIASIPSSVCLKCHEKIPAAYPVMHGPVAAGECLFCHEPHESPVANLLKAAAPRLCAQCHVPENMFARPEHKDLKADCLSCHFGHGGPSHGLVRVSNPATRPTTRRTISLLPPAAGGTGL